MPYYYPPGPMVSRGYDPVAPASKRPAAPAPVPAPPPPAALTAPKTSTLPAALELSRKTAAVVEAFGEAVLITNGAGIIEALNAEVERLWGYPKARLIGKKLSFLISNDAQRRPLAQDGEEGGVVRRLRLDAYRSDGTTFPIEARISRIPLEGPTRFLVAARDVTEQARTEEKLRSLEKALATLKVGVSITDLDHKIVYANPAQAEMHGYTVEELTGRDARALNPRDLCRPYGELAATRTWRRESENVRRDGSRFPVELVSDVVAAGSGAPLGVVTICQDIADRRRAEQALRESEERYALAVRGANDGIWDWNIQTGVIYFSPRWKAMLGYGEAEVGASPEDWFRLVHPQDVVRLQQALAAHLTGEAPFFEIQHRMLHRDGAHRWMLSRGAALRDEQGRAMRLAGSQTDITDRAVQDPLTDLPSRSVFVDRLGAALERFRRGGAGCAVLFLDLDRFKAINDTLGHDAGDRLLITVARRIESCLGSRDTAARLGGDEFAVLLDLEARETPPSEVAQRIERELARPVALAGQEVTVQASLGIAYSSPAHQRVEEILRDADAAMYRVKARRGDRELFDSHLRSRSLARLQLETDLRKAAERGELALAYQPIASLSNRSIAGFEALLRWHHPRRGVIQPSEFIPFAEESGLIVPLGQWVLREACRQIRAWERQFGPLPGLNVSVNISARQLARSDLLARVEESLNDAGISPERLKIEITESSLIEDPETVAALLHRLRDLGVQICLDDFGTGYSSLSTLHRFPVDLLKIDRSFFSQPQTGGGGPELVEMILRLARDLGMGVIAEGIETPEQAASLRRLQCEYVQGFWFSPPLDPEEAFGRLVPKVVPKAS
ncbi:MAG TPA: EAL domain-containing protein [Thermoanaerobaculia bacterium]